MWKVEVPRIVWPNALSLLTTDEINRATPGNNCMIAIFTKEGDARAFTQMLREENNVLLAATEMA